MERKSAEPVLAISIGCPSGIGPEVAVRAAASTTDALCLLVGDWGIIERAAGIVGVSAERFALIHSPSSELSRMAPGTIGVFSPGPPLPLAQAPFGQPTPEAGRAQLAWIDAACDLAKLEIADALVTGPVSKQAIIASKASPEAERFLGHTEHLARRLDAGEVTMAFWAEELVVGLVTTHLPLRKVPDCIRPESVALATVHLARFVEMLGIEAPRIAVASLNPHAGEGGVLGDEEASRIAPGIARAREELASAGSKTIVSGPIGAETAIRLAHFQRDFDAVLAMYHDQATIPMKLIGFGEAVNITLGLPILRTSVDHGTAYDLAGSGHADHRGMRAALLLAQRLAASRLAHSATAR